MTHDGEEELGEDRARLVEEALLQFNYNFSQYVSEMDKELWDRAVDFAATMTNYPGVSFEFPKED